MNINSNIDWRAGMELTAQTLNALNDNLSQRQAVLNCIAYNNRIGILPNTTFNCKGRFVQNTLEVERFKCCALLSSGSIIQADEDLSVKIPILYGNRYYLVISESNKQVHFQKDGVSLVRPKYEYDIKSLSEIEKGAYFPIMRFDIQDGNFNISEDYIPPMLLISGDKRFNDFLDKVIEALTALCDHPNMEDGEGKRCLLHYCFILKSYPKKQDVRGFISFIQEIAQAVDYHIMRPNTQTPEPLQEPSEYDIQQWMSWFLLYLDGVKSVVDGIVLEDHSIDYEKLKREIIEELYARITPEMFERICAYVQNEVRPDIEKAITAFVTHYIADEVRPALFNDLRESLYQPLYDTLYDALYRALYDALYVPVEEEHEEEFTPQI